MFLATLWLMVTVKTVSNQVKLCACSTDSSTQRWDWGSRNLNDGYTQPQPLRLSNNNSTCVTTGGVPGHPSYLHVAPCTANNVFLSLQPSMNGGTTRDTQIITNGSFCVDADSMTDNLQLYHCIMDDNDQQYTGIDGLGYIIDLWTGFSNCIGVDTGNPSDCPPARGAHPPRPPAPPNPGVSTWLSPQYHINDGPHWMQDPSGCLNINGTWFVFPDEALANSGASGAVFTSTDLVHWTRRATNNRFHETGGVAVLANGMAVTFGSGFRVADTNTDKWLSSWKPGVLTGPDPHIVARNGESTNTGLFRVGDPSAPFIFNGSWYMVLGAGRNATNEHPMQGEARLIRALNDNLTQWEFVSVMFASNQTIGHWAAPLSNMFECPDFFPIGNSGKWMFITSQIFQGHAWVTGANHHWDQYRIGSFDGVTFTPQVQGVLDYGYVAAGKSGGNETRRVFFGWNMPWSRQGANGAEGPELLRSGEDSVLVNTSDQVWPNLQPFGSQVLPRDLSLFENGELRITPVPELQSLRHRGETNMLHMQNVTRNTTCLAINGTQLELNVTFRVSASIGILDVPSVAVLSSPDQREITLIGANFTHIIVNQLNSSLRPDLNRSELNRVKIKDGAAFVPNRTVLVAPLPPGNSHNIRVFLDGHNLEVFGDERVSITTNLFPTMTTSQCVGVQNMDHANGNYITDLQIYKLNQAVTQGIPP
eukprot:m.78312 g.78312  ORF g.78312 m.78312 type:complete len:705 (+) comp12665_c0_seq7:96-2210(+)